MNALIFSAVSGVLMMFSGFVLKSGRAIRTLAHILLLATIIGTAMELRGISLFHIWANGLLSFDHFALLFTLIAAVSTLVFFILSSKEMEKVGINYAEYFALIFFVLSGSVKYQTFFCFCG